MTSAHPIRIPKYRRQRRPRSADQAFVEIDGRRHYLGRYGSTESRQAYHRLLAEHAAGTPVDTPPRDRITVVEVAARFYLHAKAYYRGPDGAPTKELEDIKLALRPLRRLYGRTPASEFGPKALKAVRQQWVDRGVTRGYINRHIGRIKRMFRWAASEELIDPRVHHGLLSVDGLRAGRTAARETPPVEPVPDAWVDAVQPHVSCQVWALIQLQRLTAARPGELVLMRPIDLDTTGCVWTYTPQTHKTAYRGHRRTIYLGPRAQEVLRPFLTGRALAAPLFSPTEAESERRDRAHASRRTPLSCGNRPDSNKARAPKRPPGARYTPTSYRRAIARACAAAGVPAWSPYRLRHNAATFVRKEFGLEAAQLILGHARADVTQVYAEANEQKALSVAATIG